MRLIDGDALYAKLQEYVADVDATGRLLQLPQKAGGKGWQY